MLVTSDSIPQALQAIEQAPFLAIDCETTGLRSYHGDQPFSIIVATEKDTFYFNLNEYPGVEPLPPSCIGELARVLESTAVPKVFHNAKFDLAMLSNLGVQVKGPLLDLWTLDRLHDNQHFAYGLDDVAKRWGREKTGAEVDEYIKKAKLSKWVEVPHLNKRYKEKYFSQVPLEIIQPYAENDARITYDISQTVLGVIADRDKCAPANWPKISQVVENESRLIETLFRMEKLGVQVDLRFCEEARAYYENLVFSSAQEFTKITGIEFTKGESVFSEVFKDESLKYTEKGNPIFDKKAMAGFKHPAAACVIAYSEAKKQLEYFQNFLWFADKEGVIHSDFVQAGANTGRFSSRDPNLQNLTNPDKYGDDDSEDSTSKYPVRRAFIPRKGFFFAMLDYSQIEYRVMLDVAKANRLINLILEGLDVHSATSQLASVSRKFAKTVNFLTLYGGGVAKLANNLFETRGSLQQLQVIWKKHLGMKLEKKETDILPTVTDELFAWNMPLLLKAREIQDAIFKASPEIKDFIKSVSKTAKDRGFIRNWFGRRYYFSNKNFAYKAPNHYVQGSCADILKVAMNRIDELLLKYESRMILTIHDELVFEIKFGEEHLIEEIKKIMESVYPYKRLPLLVEVEYSFENLADKQEWQGIEKLKTQMATKSDQTAQLSAASVGL